MTPFDLARSAWNFITSPLGRGLMVAFVLGALWFRGDHYRDQRDQALAWKHEVVEATRFAANHPKLGDAHVAQQIRNLGASIANFRTAMAEAKAKALTNKVRVEADNEQKRKDADHAYHEELAEYRRRADANARAHGVCRPDAGGDPAGGRGDERTNLPGSASSTNLADGPDRIAGLPATRTVVISLEAYGRCTTIAARLTNARDWALSIPVPPGKAAIDQPPKLSE